MWVAPFIAFALQKYERDLGTSGIQIRLFRWRQPAAQKKEETSENIVKHGISKGIPEVRLAYFEHATYGLGNYSQGDANTVFLGTCVDLQNNLGVFLGVLAEKLAPADPHLAAVLSAWETLPEPIKAGITAMVHAAGPVQKRV